MEELIAGDLYGAENESASSTEYKTVYEGTGIKLSDYQKAAKFKGDAIWETSNGYDSWNRADLSWFDEIASFPESDYAYFKRGGVSSSSSSGLFYFDHLDQFGMENVYV